jgi:hypothetical protein
LAGVNHHLATRTKTLSSSTDKKTNIWLNFEDRIHLTADTVLVTEEVKLNRVLNQNKTYRKKVYFIQNF